MIQFNLLPDVKKEYVKARRAKRLITTISMFASIGAIAIVVLMYSIVNIAQKKYINDLTNDIQSITSDINSTENLDNILTVQNQLSLLPGLHENKPQTSRIYGYVKFVTPEKAKVSTLDINIASSTIVLSGSADSIATINRFVDNLKAVQYSTLENQDQLLSPFTKVTTGLNGEDKTASFKITLIYDPVIFNNTNQIIMNIGTQKYSTDKGDQ